jgi:hypothetical protein
LKKRPKKANWTNPFISRKLKLFQKRPKKAKWTNHFISVSKKAKWQPCVLASFVKGDHVEFENFAKETWDQFHQHLTHGFFCTKVLRKTF